MPISQPKTIFGVHSITAYNIDTRQPLTGIVKVVGSAELSSEGELIPLNGGSSKSPFKVERGLISAEISLTLKEYPEFLFEALLGKAMTINGAEAGGSVKPIANAKGTSIVASTGLASVGVKAGSESDVKFSDFVVKAVSATTVDVYALTDLDFGNGTGGEFVDDTLKITSTPLTITSGTSVEIAGYGVELIGGAGSIAFVDGDTATFSSKPINLESQEVVIGSSTEVFNDFGLVITAQRPGDRYMTVIDCYRVAGAGLPISFSENAFSEASVTLQMYRDSQRDGVYELKRLQAIT